MLQVYSVTGEIYRKYDAFQMCTVCDICIAGISGFVGARMYTQMGGENWVWNVNLTSLLFAGQFTSS